MIVTSARADYQSCQRPTSAGEAYEVCLRSDERGADLISDALPSVGRGTASQMQSARRILQPFNENAISLSLACRP